LLAGELDTAVDELWIARELEPELDRLGAAARDLLPKDWEMETDLTPLARALSARSHLRAGEVWRRLLEDRPARSVQAEAAEWLAREAFAFGHAHTGLRMLHASTRLGHVIEPEIFVNAYKQAGLDPLRAYGVYLAASRADSRTARATGLHDPLTDLSWADQDPRWWLPAATLASRPDDGEHQIDALHRARDLAVSRRDQGWLLLAEGDFTAGPLGVRTLGRNVRAGCAEAADDDAFLRIRLAYEGAADRLPDVAWPWYRLAELLAWAGFADKAQEQLIQAEKRSLGSRAADRVQRPVLRGLVEAGLGRGASGLSTASRPYPTELFTPSLLSRFRLG
jgi:hypothetical protein